MTTDLFFEKVAELRKQQKMFFKTRDKYLLFKCKKLELEIDQALLEYYHDKVITENLLFK